jgi:hypothetical protein
MWKSGRQTVGKGIRASDDSGSAAERQRQRGEMLIESEGSPLRVLEHSPLMLSTTDQTLGNNLLLSASVMGN